MTMLRTGMILASAAAALLLPASGPAARNIKAKPDPAACAQARSRGENLPGCPRPDNPDLDTRSGTGGSPPPPGGTPPTSSSSEAPVQGPRDGFMVCPQDPRCPK
jgi:hypothetical protein